MIFYYNFPSISNVTFYKRVVLVIYNSKQANMLLIMKTKNNLCKRNKHKLNDIMLFVYIYIGMVFCCYCNSSVEASNISKEVMSKRGDDAIEQILNNYFEPEEVEDADTDGVGSMGDEINIKQDSKQIIQNKNEELIESDEAISLRNQKIATLIMLNKITTKTSELDFEMGKVKFFGNLSIEVHKCIEDTDLYKPNYMVLLTVFDNKIDDDPVVVFHGWMVSNNLSISTMEHPVYEIIVSRCRDKQ